MPKNILILLFTLFVVVKLQVQMKESTFTISIDSHPEEDNLDEETKNINKMKYLLDLFIETRHWDSDTRLDPETFTQMFAYVVHNSIFTESKHEDMELLGERIMEKYGKPIFVENVNELFVVDELKSEFNKLKNPENQ